MKCAIMFADIVGSTQLYDRLGDIVAADCVNQCLGRMAEITGRHNGVVINTIGDEILCRFVHASDAVRTATRIQEEFSSGPLNDHNVMLSLRIGIHYGEIINRDSDVFGDVVNVAARVAGIATGKQILTTEEAIKQLAPDLLHKTRRFDQIEVRGKQQSLTLFEVLWEETRNITMMRSSASSLDNNQSLHLVYKAVNKAIQHNSPPFVLGRSPDSDLVIEAELVSRIHAYCTYRRGKFILIDQSTNGTFVQSADNREVYLRREEIPLVGRGFIGLGESTSMDHGQIIQYICV